LALMTESHAALVRDFLRSVTHWAEKRPDMVAVALVGSWARGTARAESDVDLLLLLDAPERYLKDRNWVSLFGRPVWQGMEDWGKVQSVRVRYESGLEAEYGLAPCDWGSDETDPGDSRVVADGIIVLWERGDVLSRRLVAQSLPSRRSVSSLSIRGDDHA
jgi:uncharacterized protein